ncbi:DNA polymerase III subunit alpha [Patescibacteria group bacterium]|nr:DNA polymerase III subunit alpha [Patescibacteria group bacterium]
MSKFVHLHTHSHYSLLNALPKIKDLVAAAKKHEMTALALTDNGNMYGALEFYKTCKAENIKPILGIDAYIALRTRFDKESGIDNQRFRVVLLAENNKGYKNLLKLVTQSHLEGFYYKPRIDRKLLEQYSDGLIAILPSFSGEIATALKNKNKEKALEVANWYTKTFSNNNVYLEITHHPEIAGQKELQKSIIAFSKESGIPLVAAHDVYYIKKEDKKAREILIKIQAGIDFRERGNRDTSKEDFSFIDGVTAENYFKNIPEAIENTEHIAKRCNLNLTLGIWVFPELILQNNDTPNAVLRDMVYKALKKKNIKKTKEVEKRIEYELKVIQSKGYASYFLVVSDLIRYAHDNDILTTTRGSAAGSMVSYLADITNINPIEYELPFERFLNPYRPSPPDIDMDFADNRRDEVIQYAKEKYGEDRVAQIGTFGTMMARGAVRDVARALEYPYGTGDKIAKLIPIGAQGFPMTIDKALGLVAELKDLYKKNKDVKKILDLAKKIEGLARHISVHAAGIVIAPKPLVEFVPLQLDPKGGKIITQYDMYSVEETGLLKFDFLGIKNLAILADAVSRAKKFSGVDINIEHIPLDDKKTFEMLARGETAGLFQLSGGGMTRYLKELKPTTIHDINAMVALYRPGPMNNILEYIERKHGRRPITYYHPKMKSFLEKSFGILVYQDDLLFTALEIAGYDWESVDKFRKAVGKKIPEEMAKQHEIFVTGCMKHSNMKKKEAEGLWKLFEPFQGYGFNKAHAASYGKVAYQTAYMKANFPALYMAAVLTADSGDIEKVSETIRECTRIGIVVLPPDINESYGDFAVIKDEKENKIRFGLHSIKNFGDGIADAIIQERKTNGRYASLADFLGRIIDKNLNKKSLESLIQCGALDEFEERGTMVKHIGQLLEYNRESTKLLQSSHESLFAELPEEPTGKTLLLEKANPISQEQKLLWEKELLGLYVSGHPLDTYKNKLSPNGRSIEKIKAEFKEGMTVVISGIVEEVKLIRTKNGDAMVFARVADFDGSIEVVVFPKIFSEYHDLFKPQQCISVKGRLSGRNDEKSIIAERVKML